MRWRTANTRRDRPPWAKGKAFRDWCIFGGKSRRSWKKLPNPYGQQVDWSAFSNFLSDLEGIAPGAVFYVSPDVAKALGYKS